MQRSVGLAGVAQDRIGHFSQAILRLSGDVGKTPQELAEGFYFIASSGIAASKAMSVLTEAAKGSQAGLGDTKTVADALTSAINAYGIANLNASQAADVLAATVREGKGEAAQFAPVIGNVVALASQLGVSFDQVGAALAAQTRLGTDAETTAIQLQRIFSSLLKVTPQSAEAFKRLGLSAKGLRKDLSDKGLLFVLEKIKFALKHGKIEDLTKAFGDVRALRGILALVGKQSEQVRKVFLRMANSTGSAQHAFDAFTKTAQFQFSRLEASANKAGIALGAIVAPLAAGVAGALATASNKLADFFNRLGKAKGAKAKFQVVVTGLRGIKEEIETKLKEVNFGEVGRKVSAGIIFGIKAGLQQGKAVAQALNQAINQIDFEKVGKKLGPLFATAILTAFTTITDPAFWIRNWKLALAVAFNVITLIFPEGRIGQLLGRLFSKPFLKLGELIGPIIGKSLGRGLLRLSDFVIASTKVFGKLIPSLSGVIGRLGGRLAAALEELGFKLFAEFTQVFGKLPRVVDTLLKPLTGVITRIFNKLGKVTQFAVKVLGLTAAINAILHFAERVGHIFVALGAAIVNFFGFVIGRVKLVVLEGVRFILQKLNFKVLGHHVIPGVNGLVKDITNSINKIKEKKFVKVDVTQQGVNQVKEAIDGIKGKTVTINVQMRGAADFHAVPTVNPPEFTPGGGGGGGGGNTGPSFDSVWAHVLSQAAAAQEGLNAQLKDSITRTQHLTNLLRKDPGNAKLQERITSELKQQADLRDQIAQKRKQDHQDALQRVQDAIAEKVQVLDIAEAWASMTPTLNDDLKVAKQRVAFLQKEVALHKKDLGLQQQLVEAVRQERDFAIQARTAREFRVLGLGPTGEEAVPSSKTLRKRLGSITNAITGTFLDTKKTRSLLQRIRRLFQEFGGHLTKDVRAKVKEILDDLDQQIKDHAGSGPLTKTTSINSRKLVSGLGLTGEQIRQLRSRVSNFNSAGVGLAVQPGTRFAGGFEDTRPLIVESNVTVNIDGKKVANVVTRNQQKSQRRNPKQKRGPNRRGA